MSDQRDEFYQPWLREAAVDDSAPVKRRFDGAAPNPGLARDDVAPLGVDLSSYVLDEVPHQSVPGRMKPMAIAAKSGVEKLIAASGQGARGFADWTIRLGDRADVPARVTALEIPRRSAILAQRAGTVVAAAGRAAAASSGKAGAAAVGAVGKFGLQAKAMIARAGARGVAVSGQQIAKLRAQTPPSAPPASGLDRLLESETQSVGSGTSEAVNLPLFSVPPTTMAPPPQQDQPAASQPPSNKPAPEKPASGPSVVQNSVSKPLFPAAGNGGGTSVGSSFGAGLGSLPHWVPWGAGALALMALMFWLGSQWGGGETDRAEVAEIVRETILANPEIVPAALEKHQANQIATAIDAVRPVLEKPFSGAWAGNAKGDVTVTIFTDYGCVFCRATVADVDRLVREDKRVKVVYRELPIIAPQSKDAAIAALAAARQGKYDAFHHAMFAASGLDRASIEAASTRAGVILDDRSDAGFDARLFEAEIDKNLELAQQLGVNATPTWVIGSTMLQGAVGYDAMVKAVAAARDGN